MVHDAVEAVKPLHHRSAIAVVALICCIGLLAGCGDSGGTSKQRQEPPQANVGSIRQADCTGDCGDSSRSSKNPPRHPTTNVGSVRQADCTDWKNGDIRERRRTLAALRKFAGGPVGSSAGIQRGPVLDDRRAYKVMQSYCTKRFARGFKLYKLYEHAASFVGH